MNLLFFYLNGCDWCKKQKKVLEQINGITIIPIEHNNVSPRWKINRFPTLVLTDDSMDNPRELDRMVGFKDQGEVRNMINKNVKRQQYNKKPRFTSDY
jgi:glutaredoxin